MQDDRIAGVLSSAYNFYDQSKKLILSARRDMPGSRRLSNQADMILELVRSVERAPHTNFMLEIAVNTLKLVKVICADEWTLTILIQSDGGFHYPC